jgi:hypothetical protein
MMHVESLGSTCRKVGHTVNVYAFMAKNKAFIIYLCRLDNQAFERDEEGQGSRQQEGEEATTTGNNEEG